MISGELFRVIVDALARRWPDISEDWKDSSARAIFWSYLRDLPEPVVLAAVERVLETGADELSPYDVAKALVSPRVNLPREWPRIRSQSCIG